MCFTTEVFAESLACWTTILFPSLEQNSSLWIVDAFRTALRPYGSALFKTDLRVKKLGPTFLLKGPSAARTVLAKWSANCGPNWLNGPHSGRISGGLIICLIRDLVPNGKSTNLVPKCLDFWLPSGVTLVLQKKRWSKVDCCDLDCLMCATHCACINR